MQKTNWIYFKPVYAIPSPTFDWIFEAMINIITRFSVPAFVMLSGAFVLQNEKNADMNIFYKKSLKKIFLPTALVIILLIVVQLIINQILHKSVFYDIKGVFIGNFYTLWYIYMLAGIYFLTPFVIRMKKNLTWNQYRLFGIIMMLWAVVSQATSEQKLAYSIGVVFAFLAYYLMGDIIKTELDRGWEPRKWMIVVIILICVAATFVFRVVGYNYYISKAYINFFSPTIVIYSICVFILFGRMTTKCNLSRLSSITFEIYLFHMLILRGLSPLFIEFNPLIGEFLMVAGTFLISLCVAIVYRKIGKAVSFGKWLEIKINNSKIWRIFE